MDNSTTPMFTTAPDTNGTFNSNNTNITNDDDYYYYDDWSIYQRGDFLYYVISPILVPLGILGNLVSFVVLMQLSKSSSFFTYLSVLSLSDLAFIISGSLMRWIEVLRGIKFYENYTSYFCSVNYALVFIFSQFSAWILIAVTVDRMIAVCFPLKAADYCTKKRALIYMVVVFLTISAVNFPNICFEWEGFVCIRPDITESFCFHYSVLIDLSLYFFAPAGIISALNICIIRAFFHAKKIRSQLGSVKDNTRRTTTLLIVVTTVYILTSLPMAVESILAYIDESNTNETETRYFINVILEMANTINHSINFILYGISGKMFRQQLLKMICFDVAPCTTSSTSTAESGMVVNTGASTSITDSPKPGLSQHSGNRVQRPT